MTSFWYRKCRPKDAAVSNHGFAIDEDRKPAAQTADVMMSMLRFIDSTPSRATANAIKSNVKQLCSRKFSVNETQYTKLANFDSASMHKNASGRIG
jgi:hypothetical protein